MYRRMDHNARKPRAWMASFCVIAAALYLVALVSTGWLKASNDYSSGESSLWETCIKSKLDGSSACFLSSAYPKDSGKWMAGKVLCTMGFLATAASAFFIFLWRRIPSLLSLTVSLLCGLLLLCIIGTIDRSSTSMLPFSSFGFSFYLAVAAFFITTVDMICAWAWVFEH